jgi:hypothetical protein
MKGKEAIKRRVQTGPGAGCRRAELRVLRWQGPVVLPNLADGPTAPAPGTGNDERPRGERLRCQRAQMRWCRSKKPAKLLRPSFSVTAGCHAA